MGEVRRGAGGWSRKIVSCGLTHGTRFVIMGSKGSQMGRFGALQQKVVERRAKHNKKVVIGQMKGNAIKLAELLDRHRQNEGNLAK